MMKDAPRFEACRTLGNTLTLEESQIAGCTEFICCLYGDTKCTSLNELRCKKAEKGIPVKKLPPTQDSFILHLKCAIYQLYIWRNAHIPIVEIPPATEFGYEKSEDGTLAPMMMAQQPAVPELLNLVVCDCSEDSCSSNCSCFKHNQPCTSACACEAARQQEDSLCLNPLTIQAYDNSNDENDVND